MVKYDMIFTAQLENVADVEPTGEGSLFGVSLEMLCSNCGVLTTKKITVVARSEWSNLHNAPRNTLQCISCARTCKFKIKRIRTEAFSGVNTPIAQLECVGFVPSGYAFEQCWTVKSSAGTVYENVDLSMDFYNYDPNGNFLISIRNPELCFQEVKEMEGTSSRAPKQA